MEKFFVYSRVVENVFLYETRERKKNFLAREYVRPCLYICCMYNFFSRDISIYKIVLYIAESCLFITIKGHGIVIIVINHKYIYKFLH